MEKIKMEIINQKKGAFVRVIYKSDLEKKLKASARHDGYRVEKVTETTGRTGIAYNNIAKVMAKKESGERKDSTRHNPYTWLVDNKIKVHENGTEYLVLGTVPENSNTKTKYIIYHGSDVRVVDKLSEADKELLFIPSAFSGLKEEPEVLTIKLQNIIKFNGVA